MNQSLWISRRVCVVAILCGAALGSAGHVLRTRMQADGTGQRPAADAPVHVVKAPGEPLPGAAAGAACTTCAMGAGRSPQ
jgi:hypothetical protein